LTAIEEARREVLGVPDDFEHTADDFLDLLAEGLLEERRAMVEAAPTPLARSLISTGKTRSDLAATLGVSVTAVGHWASGEKPLPGSRLVEISLALGVKPSDLMDSRPAPDTAGLSYFGWMIEHVVMLGYYGPPRHEIALKLGITLAKLRGYTHGGVVVPEATVLALTKAYLPLMAGMLSPSLEIGPRPT
jgi:DNA-binding transcriptional regulator YdaS (Cro superfamily)